MKRPSNQRPVNQLPFNRYLHSAVSLFANVLSCLTVIALSIVWDGIPGFALDDIQQRSRSFELPGTNGSSVTVSKSQSPTILLFMGTECPLVRLYCKRVQEIAESQKPPVRVVGIDSNQQDSLEELEEFGKSFGISFELAKDYQNKVADQFGATRTPEVFLLDPELNILYRGQVDDQHLPGKSKPSPLRHYLRDALDQYLAKNKIDVSQTEPVGCLIGKVRKANRNSKVTYTNQISRLIQKHCLECHRPNEIGPFAMDDYEEVVGWSEMMLEVIDENRMPPWHADPQHGEFKNSRGMSDEEKNLFSLWVKNGSPYGDQKELPPKQTFAEGWDMESNPDIELKMKTPYPVPENGIVDYQYFVVDPGFKKDQWIRAAQVLPGKRGVVHHSIVFIRRPDGSRFRGIGWLAAYVPGQRAAVLPDGHARLIPAGSKLVFQQHYTPNGRAQDDQTRIGLWLAKQPVEHEVVTYVGLDQEFSIPELASNHQVKAELNLPKRGQLLSMTPHMHLRGKSFQAIGFQAGKKKILCSVPQYDFNWQHNYIFRKPLDLAEWDRMEMLVTFDNSEKNPVNPNPNQKVFWGDQTFEEMAVAFFDVAIPVTESLGEGKIIPVAKKPASRKDRQNQETLDRATPSDHRFADAFFRQWDENQNGVVERSEAPIALRDYGFWQYDSNRDGQLTREEVLLAKIRTTGRQR